MNPIVAQLNTRLAEAITAALAERYTSTSCVQAIPTGNAYQSIRLGGRRLEGFRDGREALFKRFNFAGRNVIDLGANLGENSRLALERGAAFAYAVEYDELFSHISSLVSAHNGVRNIATICGDASTLDFSPYKVDVAMMFSVWPYVENRIDDLHALGVRQIVLETHHAPQASDIGPYLQRLAGHYPYYSLIASTDHGNQFDGRRFVLVAAPNATACMEIASMERSIAGLARIYETIVPAARDAAAASGPFEGSMDGVHDPRYWRNFLRGHAEWRASGSLSDDNSYVREMRSMLSGPTFDPHLANSLIDTERLYALVQRRFVDADRISSKRDLHLVDPLVAYVPHAAMQQALASEVFDIDGTKRHADDNYWIDGYHRLFMMAASGVRKAPVAIRFHFAETSVY